MGLYFPNAPVADSAMDPRPGWEVSIPLVSVDQLHTLLHTTVCSSPTPSNCGTNCLSKSHSYLLRSSRINYSNGRDLGFREEFRVCNGVVYPTWSLSFLVGTLVLAILIATGTALHSLQNCHFKKNVCREGFTKIQSDRRALDSHNLVLLLVFVRVY